MVEICAIPNSTITMPVALVQKECLEAHGGQVQIVDRVSGTADVVFLHGSDNGSENDLGGRLASFVFQHLTMSPSLPHIVEQGRYKSVVHSEIMSDIHVERFGVSPIIVHNFASWQRFRARQCAADRSVVWYGYLHPDRDRTVFFEAADYCRRQGLELTVVSHSEPPISVRWYRGIRHEEAAEFLSSFEFGIGVGRSLIEMSMLGLKTIAVNSDIKSEHITKSTIEQHMRSNFNGRLTKTEASIAELFETAQRRDELVASTLSCARMHSELSQLFNQEAI